MFDETTILIVCAAGAVGSLVFFLLKFTVGGEQDTKLRDRLSKGPANTQSATEQRGPVAEQKKANLKEGLANAFVKIGQAAAEPFMPKSTVNLSNQRQALAKAGLYSPSALRTMNGAKAIFLAVGLVAGYLIGLASDKMFMMLSLGGLIGFLGPRMWLKLRTRGNQRELTCGLPDALDLMVVCVEAGLTVDAAMQRVGQELGLAHPAVAREFGIAHMETRVGLTRSDALKNLGTRTGNASLQSLAAMLVQADRFGTSIAQALRVFADTLRTNRQHAAEEMAAKASVKISFPLVLFIFPSTFIVLCGPVIIELMNSSLFN
jgi:tight adherence protein C